MEFFLSASNGILGLPIQACILSHWHASMPTFPSKCRKESEKPTGSSRDEIDGKERGPLQPLPKHSIHLLYHTTAMKVCGEPVLVVNIRRKIRVFRTGEKPYGCAGRGFAYGLKY